MAEEQTGIKACNIALVLKNIRYQTGGFIFRYKTEDFSYKIPIIPNNTQKKIICKYDLEDNLIKEVITNFINKILPNFKYLPYESLENMDKKDTME